MSGDPELDRRIGADARRAGCLFYAHDQPAISDFALPAVARRGALTLAISTDGLAPSLAGHLRRELQRLLDDAGRALDDLLERVAAARTRLPRSGRKARLAELTGRLKLRGRLAIDD